MSDRRKAETALYAAAHGLCAVECNLDDALYHIEAEGYPGNAHLAAALTDYRATLTRIRERLYGFEVRS